MLFPIPTYHSRRIRLLALGYGLSVFLWLRIEDNSALPAVVAGQALSLLLAVLWVTRNYGGTTLRLHCILPGAMLLGAVCGLATAATTTGLMLLKNGMHGHSFPDFPFGVIVEILQRAPLWALAGGLTGLGLAFAWWALRYRNS
jgi:hypothetical protein